MRACGCCAVRVHSLGGGAAGRTTGVSEMAWAVRVKEAGRFKRGGAGGPDSIGGWGKEGKPGANGAVGASRMVALAERQERAGGHRRFRRRERAGAGQAMGASLTTRAAGRQERAGHGRDWSWR